MSPLHADASLHSGYRIPKRNGCLVLEVVPSFGISPGGAHREELREHRPLRRRRTGKAEVLEVESPGRMRFVPLEDSFRIKAVTVVKVALQRIAQYLVGL